MAANFAIFRTKVVFKVNNYTSEQIRDVTSNPFVIGSDKWRVIFNKSGSTHSKHVDIVVEVSKTLDWNFAAKLTAYILDRDYQRIQQKTIARKWLSLYCKGFTLEEFVKESDLFNERQRCLPNNCLTFGFDITVYKTFNSGHNMRRHFGSSFLDKELSDCRLLVGGKEFFASKAILSVRSEVFRQMFASDMSEKASNEVIIDDIDANVFEEFLRFLYFGDSQKLDPMAEELIAVADKYMVSDLKTICENLYYLQIHPKNAFNVLEVMDKYRNKDLRIKAIEFIKDNGFECLETQWHKHFGDNKQLINQMVKHLKTDHKTSRKVSDIKSYTYLASN